MRYEKFDFHYIGVDNIPKTFQRVLGTATRFLSENRLEF